MSVTVVGEDVSEGARIVAMIACQRKLTRRTRSHISVSCGDPVIANAPHAGQMEQAGIQAGIPVQVKKQLPARLRFQVSKLVSCAGDARECC